MYICKIKIKLYLKYIIEKNKSFWKLSDIFLSRFTGGKILIIVNEIFVINRKFFVRFWLRESIVCEINFKRNAYRFKMMDSFNQYINNAKLILRKDIYTH